MYSFLRKCMIITVLTLYVLWSTLIMTSAAQSNYHIGDLNGKYKTQGRTQVLNDGICLEWSMSGIEFQADCVGDISIIVDDVDFSWNNPINMPTENRGKDTGGLYYTVIIDGVKQYNNERLPIENSVETWKSNTEYPFHITKSQKTEFVIARNLSKGVHTISIYKQDEASDGKFSIKSISLNGEILPAPTQKKLYVEFVGDSITSGHGNLVIGGDVDAPLYKDVTRGWPFLTADKLKADWSVIATSGITTTSMSYQYQFFDVALKNKYEFKKEPDVIVVGLGTNDIWTKGEKTDIEIQQAFIQLLTVIRNKNPNSKIIWIYGMMIPSANKFIINAVKNMGGAEKGCYSLKLPKDLGGGGKHPGLSAQLQYADIVADYIDDILNSENTLLELNEFESGGNEILNSNNDSRENIDESNSVRTGEIDNNSVLNDNTGKVVINRKTFVLTVSIMFVGLIVLGITLLVLIKK